MLRVYLRHGGSHLLRRQGVVLVEVVPRQRAVDKREERIYGRLVEKHVGAEIGLREVGRGRAYTAANGHEEEAAKEQ